MKLRLGWDPLTGRAILSENVPSRARYAAAGGTNLAVDVALPITETVGAGPIERRYVAPQPAQDAPRAPLPAAGDRMRVSRSRGVAASHAVQAGARGRAVQQRNRETETGRWSCAHVSDMRLIATLRETNGNGSWAAQILGVTVSSLHRRVSSMRRAGRLPADLPTGRAAMYVARRARGTVAA